MKKIAFESISGFGWRVAALAVGVVAFSGCATVVSSNDTTSIRVTASCGELENLGAYCRMWGQNQMVHFTTPATVQVSNAVALIGVTCSGDMVPPTSAVISPRPHGAILGNILVGGVVGVAVDSISGRGWVYPRAVNLHSERCH